MMGEFERVGERETHTHREAAIDTQWKKATIKTQFELIACNGEIPLDDTSISDRMPVPSRASEKRLSCISNTFFLH